ncbi:glucan endo-1 3-beta-glucosidase 8 [Phtheirospermum japonicum]|uniref:Glucan endo-1 3-beta-glucosidase 8 n=1 Tax=Phtheirospermum japonicum TaxID=374723 RepID=A0A830BX00_9LAMI|nr:glucan endo-1 3-beta-glucosidase 8 [Phtheirospermum japonicum]
MPGFYSSQKDILQAFSGSGINLTIGIYNPAQIANQQVAEDWVQDKVVEFYGRSSIRRIYIGNYVFKYRDPESRGDYIASLGYLQTALNNAGYGALVKATMTHSSIVLKPNITRPSEAEFRNEIIKDMNKVLAILKNNNSPFVIEIFPALYVRENIHLDPTFAFPDNSDPARFVKDVNGLVYTNAFDFLYDAFLWALEKAGAGDLELVVDQVCWPTDGFPGGNSSAAERFFRALLPRVAGNRGTPKRPGRPIETYVHSLADETMMPDFEPWGRHWGIYRSNGEPKYKIDLTGQGRDIFPARAKGIMRMPERWCVFNNATRDLEKVKRQAKIACDLADCTSLAPGGSCSRLSFEDTVSYKFNEFFQATFQEEGACDFEGLGEVVTENPSRGECVFPVEVVKGTQNFFDKQKGGAGAGMHGINCGYFVLLISVLWALF